LVAGSVHRHVEGIKRADPGRCRDDSRRGDLPDEAIIAVRDVEAATGIKGQAPRKRERGRGGRAIVADGTAAGTELTVARHGRDSAAGVDLAYPAVAGIAHK